MATMKMLSIFRFSKEEQLPLVQSLKRKNMKIEEKKEI